MTFGLRTRSSSGSIISEFDGDYLRFVVSIRMEALDSGSLQLDVDAGKARYFFQADNPVQTTAPLINISPSGLLTWRPYSTSPSLHTGGYILIGVIST